MQQTNYYSAWKYHFLTWELTGDIPRPWWLNAEFNEWLTFWVDEAIDVDEFMLPPGDGELGWILFEELNPDDEGCWRLNMDGDELFSFAWAKTKLDGSPTLRVLIGVASEKCEAIANDGIAGDIPDDREVDAAGTMDGGEVLFMDTNDPTVVDVEDRGDISKFPSCGDVIRLAAPGIFCWAATPICVADQVELSLILFDLPEFGVTSPCKLAEAGRIPGIPPDNVESTALIDSDDLLAPVGGADGGKFVNGVKGAWNKAIKENRILFSFIHETFLISLNRRLEIQNNQNYYHLEIR